jgi:TolB-like protein/Flp pilus assembly protein TadD
MAEEQAPASKPTPGRDVFISYASPDKAVADAVCTALETAGVSCWIAPRDVTPGEFYAESIVHALDSSKVIALVLSQHAADSNHVLREVERASSKRHPVVAFRIDVAPLPAGLEYFLNTSQWLDASATGVNRALPRFVDAVRSALTLPPTAARVPSSALTAPSANRRPTRMWATVAAFGMAALGYAVVDRLWLAKHNDQRKSLETATAASAASPDAAPEVSDKSVAVLPFTDMSEKHDQEYFGDGMAEEILDLLAKSPGLRVPARTSSFYFKGKSEDIPTIARRLSVANVLEGSVRKSGSHVRVTVQLVRADNGYHLWSETYDRTLDDLFKVQDEIAGEVVKALKISLDPTATPRAVPTNSAEAHRLFLQAQFLLYHGSRDSPKRAARYYQQAIDLDPHFAEAWAGLSRALNAGGQGTGQGTDQVRELASHAADRAVALDPKLAAAHVALGDIRYELDWDWAAANSEYEIARSLDPDDPHALNGAGLIAAVHGHLADALSLFERAAARDPLNPWTYYSIGGIYYAMGRFPESLAATRKAAELDSTSEGVHATFAWVLLAAGRKNDALTEIEKETDAAFRAIALARTYIKLGRRSDADAALAEVEQKFAADQPYSIAELHALRGESDQAFSWLNRAYQQRDSSMISVPQITVDPDMRNLHGDPRWEAFLRKMKLP